ncbi:MAG: hypothetical protein ACRBDI_09045 [Alphaproteobacteria bacterium]
MKISKQDFIDMPRKAITLLGMSGSGKTHISLMLAKQGWESYSCDYEIGTKYLKDALNGFGDVTGENISALSVFLGKVGDAAKGGYSLDLFLERQQAYYDAEHKALSDMSDALANSDSHFIHDSTGSLCEIMDDDLIGDLGEKTLFVYLKADEDAEQTVLQRAQDYPKPLFFPPSHFQGWLHEYIELYSIDGVEAVDPNNFSRWVFPKLFESRKPKYQALADQYGVTIPSKEFYVMKNSDDFITIIAEYLEN